MTALNNSIRANSTKPNIDRTLQNCKCRLCRYRNETVSHLIGEYSKLAQKEYKNIHEWVGKVIH